jgi:CRP-like cAMP-binding protein
MSIKEIFQINKWDFESQSILLNLPDEDLKMLTAHQTVQVYKKGEIIFRESAYPAGIFFIKSGKVKKYKLDKEGNEQIVYVANKGELIGFQAVLAEDRYPDSSAALEESVVMFIPREDFLKTMEHSALLTRHLLKTLSHEFAVLLNTLVLFAQRPVRERLALQLIVLREKYKENFQPGMPVVINMSREDLANLVGTARENVLRVLAEFKEKGILETKGRQIIVHDVKKLVELSNYK